ncbi:MAG TPA: LysR family transcriptional regulator [Polyangiaceae bacterium]|nr:LysR family transcriptional regulator [Polyangiaceae bacterium]
MNTTGVEALSAIAAFVRVAEAKSFTAAGKRLGLSPSAVSRAVARLEERLGVRLLHRTTHHLRLTDEGASYHERCVAILEALDDAERDVQRHRSEPRGRLRVDAPVDFGQTVLAPAVPEFLARHGALAIDLSLRDHFIDPIAEGVDVLVRMAELKESGLVSRRLGGCRTLTVASPAYFAERGRPRTPADLREHRCLGYLSQGRPLPWRFRAEGGEATFVPHGRWNTNSGPALRRAALAGVGLVSLFEFTVAPEVRAGELEIVLEAYEPPPTPIYAVYPERRLVAQKVRAFVDFLVELFATPDLVNLRAAAPARRAPPRAGRRGGAPGERADAGEAAGRRAAGRTR